MGWLWSDSVWGGFEPKSGVHGPHPDQKKCGVERTTILRLKIKTHKD